MLKPLTQQVMAPSSRNRCALCPLRLCVGLATFFRIIARLSGGHQEGDLDPCKEPRAIDKVRRADILPAQTVCTRLAGIGSGKPVNDRCFSGIFTF